MTLECVIEKHILSDRGCFVTYDRKNFINIEF